MGNYNFIIVFNYFKTSTVNTMQKQVTYWEKIFPNTYVTKDLNPKHTKNS